MKVYARNQRNKSGISVITLGTEISSGGEGKVYYTKSRKKYCVKIYHNPTTGLERKITLMSQMKPPVDINVGGFVPLAWPISPVYSDHRLINFIGFVMPTIISTTKHRMIPLREFFHFQDKRPGRVNISFLSKASAYLAWLIDSLHKSGIVVGDLNDANILVSADSRCAIIDCDSFQVDNFLCEVGRPEYLAPEFIGKNLRFTKRTVESDRFALAVMIYRLLNDGFHPYNGVWHGSETQPSITEKIKRGLFVHDPRVQNMIAPPPMAPPISNLPDEIVRMFFKAFTREAVSQPDIRPTAKQWLIALKRFHDQGLVVCRNNNNHVYSNHLSKCPWCKTSMVKRKRTSLKNNKPKDQKIKSFTKNSAKSFTKKTAYFKNISISPAGAMSNQGAGQNKPDFFLLALVLIFIMGIFGLIGIFITKKDTPYNTKAAYYHEKTEKKIMVPLREKGS